MSAATLGAALVAAQADMPAVDKDGTNPHFRNQFVTLDNLIAKTRPVLNRHGLSLMQFPSVSDLGAPTLTTRITHTSGESVEYVMPLFLPKQDMQTLGSAITYARRYAWAAALGISSDEDDDGNQATAPAADQPAVNGNAAVANAAEAAATAAQQKKLDRLIVNLGNLDPSKDWAGIAEKYCQREWQIGREQLGRVQIEQLVGELNKQLEQRQVPA
jgi:hypothetical protein